jgi:hypothetical protein
MGTLRVTGGDVLGHDRIALLQVIAGDEWC